MPCPNGVDVPANLELYNHPIAFDDLAAARFRYGFALEQKQKASECAACGACLELCPQEIPIPEWMGRAGELLG
jgi:predicted aldo/keto reductase-like oxidoreductase